MGQHLPDGWKTGVISELMYIFIKGFVLTCGAIAAAKLFW